MVDKKDYTSAENSGRRYKDPIIAAPSAPEQHPEQYAGQDEIKHWVSLEGGDIDPLNVPQEMRRQGWVVQWKAFSVLGNTDMQKKHMVDLYRAGWRAVQGERGVGYFTLPGEQVLADIRVGGSILMERPEHIDNHARVLAHNAATGQLNDKLESIGHAGTKLGPVKTSISRTVEQGMAVPE